jgi:hypothetical protein
VKQCPFFFALFSIPSLKINLDFFCTNDFFIRAFSECFGYIQIKSTGLFPKGKITLNKDFGYGYSYDVIMEEASVVKTIPASTTM